MDASPTPVAAPRTGPDPQQRSIMEGAHERLHALLTRLSTIDPFAYERGGEQPVRELRKLLQQALGELEQLASQLVELCDALDPSAAESDGGERAPVASDFGRLSDVCFIAVADTRAKQRDLIRSSFETDSLRVLSVCGSSLRRLRKALASMEAQLSRSLGLRSLVTASNTLEDSLEIRKAYSILRKTAEAAGAPAEGELRARIRAIDLRIEMLSEKSFYPRLRLDDRLQLISLQGRLRRALQSAEDPREELRLWQDAVGFTQLLSQVNLRQELREHDAGIVAAALATLERSAEPTVAAAVTESLRPLLGLHDGLDELLRFGLRERDGYLAILSVLHAGLSQHRPAQGADV